MFLTEKRHFAEVAELADALDSKSSARKGVWVRVPPSVLRCNAMQTGPSERG